MIRLTNKQARQFMLLKHGLLGEHKFIGKQGVLDFIRQTGCIQYDPIDICGKNTELTLQSRVNGFSKEMLDELLYHDRLLIDYPDKNTAIISTGDWPYFERYRKAARERAKEHPELLALMKQVLAFVKQHGVVCPRDLKLKSDFKWRAFIVWSSGRNLSSSIMEQLYGCGDLIIHHKRGSRKFYGLAVDYLPSEVLSATDPLPDESEHKKWRLLRQIGAVGFLWKRPSDALWRCTTEERNNLFGELENERKVIVVMVDGIKHPLYCRSEDMSLIESISSSHESKPRCELIAPLDPFMWDRKLISAMFGFEYTWEIYTPIEKRKYGHYVLPLLYGERFIGRIEAVADRKAGELIVKNIWYENDVHVNKNIQSAVDKCFQRFALFNGCATVVACGEKT